MDLDKIESLINSSTIAIVTTYKFGNTYSAHKIKKICDKYNILMIEDCAQAFGIINKNKFVGSIGDIEFLVLVIPKMLLLLWVVLA